VPARPSASQAGGGSSSGGGYPNDSDIKAEAAKANASGVEYLRRGMYEEAVGQFKVALRFEPDSVQILNNIGLAYAKLKDFNAAYEWYDKAYRQDTSDIETVFSLAWVERKRQRFLHARELFVKVLQVQPDHVKALYLLGDILKSSQDHEGAILYFERLVRLDRKNVDGQVCLAQCYENTRQYSRSAELYNNVLYQDPSRIDVAFYLGRVHYQLKQYQKALTAFDRVPDTDPRGFEARTYSAKSCKELEEVNRSIGYAERAAALRPHPDVMHFLGERYAQQGNDQRALGWFTRAVDADGTHKASILEAGTLQYKMGQNLEAEASFSKLLETDRNNVVALQHLALIKYKLKKMDSCKQFCDAVLRQDPLNEEVLWVLAEVNKEKREERWFLTLRYPPEVTVADVCRTIAKQYMEKKQATEGAEWMQKAKEYMPAEASRPKAAPLAAGATGIATTAVPAPAPAPAKVPQSATSHSPPRQVPSAANPQDSTSRAAERTRLDMTSETNLEAARAKYEAALKVNPSNLEALEGAAYCHRKLNDLDTAVQLYQQCLRVSPNAEGPLYYLGDILYRQHRHGECQHYLARLAELSSSHDFKTGALYLLAKSHVSLEEYGPAEKYATTGLGLKPHHPHFLFILALVKNRVGDYDASIALLNQALEHCDSPDDTRAEGSDQLKHEIYDWLAQAYERKQDYKSAMAQADLALQGDPSHVSALITKGQVHIQMRQIDKAETAFRRALAVEKNHALAMVRLGYCKLLSSMHQEAKEFFHRALQQRCGTVALPMSVKGTARVYLALTLMGQQDVDSSLAQLAEARKSHKNFKEVCSGAKETIVKGDCEGLVNRLRGIRDLDINTAQAWQLVHLMAKELELELQNKSSGDSSASKASTGSSAPPPASASGLTGMGARLASKEVVAAKPLAPTNGSTDHQARRWNAPPEAENNRRAWNAPSEAESRRQWTTPSESENRRQWVTPAQKDDRLAPPPSVSRVPSLNQGEKFQQPLKLESHELIDISEIKQGECLGTGGFGAVYKGIFKGQEVALKKLFCEDGVNISHFQLEELEKEVAALKALRHPRLVAFIGASLSPPNLCIVTEFMSGGSLHHLLHKAKTALQISQQARIALQVAEGVAFLHSLTPPVVHRDLKSLNIVLDAEYNAKICDFGLTQSMEKTHISLKDGGQGGSPRYMAPECYDTKAKITEKVDVWAEGCILIEIFGGPLPYDDCQNIQQIVAKLLIDKEHPYIPHSLVEGVRPIVEDCFHFDLDKRTSAKDVYQRLRALRF